MQEQNPGTSSYTSLKKAKRKVCHGEALNCKCAVARYLNLKQAAEKENKQTKANLPLISDSEISTENIKSNEIIRREEHNSEDYVDPVSVLNDAEKDIDDYRHYFR